jgi:oxygen-independent coproporphyrinogen-3 oxidase
MNRTGYPGLYVHVPFCKTKCPYCDFYSVPETDQAGKWLKAVLREASLNTSIPEFTRFDSLYIGGGTPSLLGHDDIGNLVRGLKETFQFDDGAEVTIELNPDDVTKENLALYRSLGVNRASLGVQSFDEEEVRFLGRRHSGRQAGEAARLVAEAGFAEFGMDLIYGLPGQSIRSWRKTLRQALSYGPAHLSCYQLTVEGDTPLSRLSREGLLELPDDARGAELFLAMSEYLTGQDFVHYEVSNFARGEETISRHNVKYWQHTPYLGLGPSAHSFSGRRRWWNQRSLDAYLRLLDSGPSAVEDSETLSEEQMRLERLLFGFRTMWGVELKELCGEYCANRLEDLVEKGLVEVRGDKVVPTLTGYLFADRLPLMVSE